MAVYVIIAALFLIGTFTSYAINQWVLRLPMSKKTAWYLSLSTWGFASIALVLGDVFPHDFWAVFATWFVVYFGARHIFIAHYKKSHRWPTSETSSRHV